MLTHIKNQPSLLSFAIITNRMVDASYYFQTNVAHPSLQKITHAQGLHFRTPSSSIYSET